MKNLKTDQTTSGSCRQWRKHFRRKMMTMKASADCSRQPTRHHQNNISSVENAVSTMFRYMRKTSSIQTRRQRKHHKHMLTTKTNTLKESATGIHSRDSATGVRKLDSATGVHKRDSATGIHIRDSAIEIHKKDLAIAIHKHDSAIGSHRLGDHRLGDHGLGDQRLGDHRMADHRMTDHRSGVLHNMCWR